MSVELRSGLLPMVWKADPETIDLAILILRQVARPSLCQGTHRGIIDTVGLGWEGLTSGGATLVGYCRYYY